MRRICLNLNAVGKVERRHAPRIAGSSPAPPTLLRPLALLSERYALSVEKDE